MTKTETLDQFLSDIEIEKVKSFVEDEVQFEAVKKVLLFNIYQNGTLKKNRPADPTRNFALSVFEQMRGGETDEKIGRTIRGMCEGIFFVESGLKDLTAIVERNKSGKVEERENPAR